MGKNVRRITKQKWIDDERILKRRVIDNKIEYYTNDENGISVIDQGELAREYIAKNTNNQSSKSWKFDPSSFRGSKENFIYKNLKVHELDCLENNLKFCGFVLTSKGQKNSNYLANCNKRNVPKKFKRQIKNNQITCKVETISEMNGQIEIKKNEFLKKLNELLFELVNKYVELYKEDNLRNTHVAIIDFDKNLVEYIKDKEVSSIYNQATFIDEMNNKLKKSTKNGKSKVNNNYLHMYYYELLFNDEVTDLVSKYEMEFYNAIKWFKNKKYELNETIASQDGMVSSGSGKEKVVEQRVYGSTNHFDVTKMYQKEETNVRMNKLLQLKESNSLDRIVDEVIAVFQLSKLQKAIVSSTNVSDELSVKKIIAIQKEHYKLEIVPCVEKKSLFADFGEEKRQLMRMFNVYLKGRYNKACKEFKDKNLTCKYLKGIYNSDKIAAKFKLNLTHKLNLFYISTEQKNNVENSSDLEYNKMLQTYNMKLIEKLDYCSKLPIADGKRISDIFYKGKFIDNKYQFYTNELIYEVDYFPIIEEEGNRKKFNSSLKILHDFRNEVLHNKLDLAMLQLSFTEAEADIIYLNSNIKLLMNSKLKYNNVYKYFDIGQINILYKSILSGQELDIFKYNINLPRFSKVFNNLYHNEIEFSWLNEQKKKVGEDQEKLGALKYLLQTIYYFGFSNTDIKIINQNLDKHITEMQRVSAIKGNSKKENQELIVLVKDAFKAYLESINMRKLSIFESESSQAIEATESAFDGISFKESRYSEQNVLLNLGYYLDPKRLSSLIHDTKKLIQSLEAIDKLSISDKEVLLTNIDMMNLLLQHKDRLKNISYEQMIKECVDTLETKRVVGENLKMLIDEHDKKYYGKVKKIKMAYEYKIDSYKNSLSMLKSEENTKQSYINNNGQVQGIYEAGGNLIIHSGIEYYQKYNASHMLDNLLEFDPSIKLVDSDIEEYQLLIKQIAEIETTENEFLSEFNNKIKNSEGRTLKEKCANEFKTRPEYQKIKDNNIQKNKYHYLNNKIKFNHIRYINSFIDDVLARMNSFMLYWERDTNKVIDKYVSDNSEMIIENKTDFEDEHTVSRKRYLPQENQAELDELLTTHVNYDIGNINALDIRNYISHNNYYSTNQEGQSRSYSLLELMNIIHDIMGYNLKYQKSVIEVFNKILLKYKIGNENNGKHKLPLRYEEGKIIINKKYFKPRTHGYFNELNLNSTEYSEHIKKVLRFKK